MCRYTGQDPASDMLNRSWVVVDLPRAASRNEDDSKLEMSVDTSIKMRKVECQR